MSILISSICEPRFGLSFNYVS